MWAVGKVCCGETHEGDGRCVCKIASMNTTKFIVKQGNG